MLRASLVKLWRVTSRKLKQSMYDIADASLAGLQSSHLVILKV